MTEMVAFLWECTFLLRCQSTPLKPPKCDTERSGTQITVGGVKRKGNLNVIDQHQNRIVVVTYDWSI
jgi:hypothetical protein